MNRYMSIVCSAVSVVMIALPCQVLAVSITPTKAAFGEGCVANGENSTAMGFDTTASGGCSTAMGYRTAAVGDYSIAMGSITRAGGDFSFAGGAGMLLTGAADHTFVWGHSIFEEFISTPDAFLIFPAGTSGRVGIGTPSPAEKLHIRERASDLGAAILLDSTGGASGRQYYVGSTLSSNIGGAGLFQIYDDTANQPRLNIDPSGNVGIGTTAPSYKLHVNGTAAGTSWTNLSSKEYKEDIQTVNKAAYPMMLAKLVDMELATYKYKNEYGGDGDTKLGFIAEDMPDEVLSKDGKGVDLYELLALTIGAIKAQQKEYEALKAKLDEALVRLKALEK